MRAAVAARIFLGFKGLLAPCVDTVFALWLRGDVVVISLTSTLP